MGLRGGLEDFGEEKISFTYRYSNPNPVCVTFMYCVSNVGRNRDIQPNATYRNRSTVGIMVNPVQETAKLLLWLDI